MRRTITARWQAANLESISKQFSRLGWIGFWVQLALLALPVLLLIYVLLFSAPESAQRRGIELSNYLSYGSLLVMLFTTFWFYRYTRVAVRIADPGLRPTQSSVLRMLWIGLWASCLGILFSVLLLMSAVGRMLFVLLGTAQTGIPIVPAMGGDPAAALSAIDALSLMTLLIILSAELIVFGLSLWLLFRVTRSSIETANEETSGGTVAS